VRRLPFDRDWRFRLGDIPDALWQGPLADADWRAVELPHDWSIELARDPAAPGGSAGGWFPTGAGWYQKRFPAPREWRGKRVLVEFDGVYTNSEVWLDEHFLGRHPYGYTGFRYDLTPWLRPGSEQVLRVLVDNTRQPSCRWYSGSGIYRHVWVWLGEPVHVVPHGVWASTPEVAADEATVRVRTTVANEGDADREVTVRSRVVGPTGKVVDSVDREETISAGERIDLEQELAVRRPRLWSLEDPVLYRMETEARVGRHVGDAVTTPFGIRSVQLGAETGLRLNGEPLKLRGGCVHHDNGPLGAASHDRAEERKVELLKANGFNAVRCAHNPPAPAFLDACDRLGLLVIDEAFDCWRNGKNVADYHVAFDDWWRRDIETMVVRDRNHPSVLMWSIGNEVVERGRPEGARLARRLAEHVRSLDPTRPVTAGVNGGHGAWGWEELDDFFAALDVCGYNYAASAYRADHARRPDRVVYGSESMARDAFAHWTNVLELEHGLGDFVWTALDYLGEAGIGRVHFDGDDAPLLGDYPWHQANCGDLDLCGLKRPQSYYRDVLWQRGRPLYLAVHPPGPMPAVGAWGWPDVRPSWTWPGHEGNSLRVDVYSACETVELFLDGESLGTRSTGRAERFTASFEVPYRPGLMRAVGTTRGERHAECELRTAGEPAGLRLTPDRDQLAGPGDLAFVTVEVVDEDGLVHPNAGHAVSFEVDGDGSIAAVANADPVSLEAYTGNRRSAYRGRCLAVLKAAAPRGEIRFHAEADGLAPAETVVRIGSGIRARVRSAR
jgi:beta-galactosidase